MTEYDTLTEIVPDIYRVYIPLPFALNIVNCYLLRGSGGWTIVDSGINTPQGRDTWLEVFRRLDIRPSDIEKIVLTHTHPDHIGLSGWLQNLAAEAGKTVPIYTSPREMKQARAIWWEAHEDEFYNFLVSSGMPIEMAREVADSMDNTRQMTRPLPNALQPIYAGNSIQLGERTFDIIHAPGHSDGQLLFYHAEDRLLLSGDHVLMKITPNIGLWPETDPNPLGRFLESLQHLKSLAVRLALPGHRRLIDDWGGRVEELINHHHARLQRTLETVADGHHTAYTASQHIFEFHRFSAHEWRFATAEAFAHLEYLCDHGQLRREDGDVRRYYIT